VSGDPSNEFRSDRGYGNIYTPSAGSMIIHVQRESGLANRTIVLTTRQVRLLRRGAYVVGGLLAIIVLSWVYLATQAARVPLLTRQLDGLQHDVSRLDTLQRALTALEGQYQQVQKMLGASAPQQPATAQQSTPPKDSVVATLPERWPLPAAGDLLLPADSAAPRRGIDIAIAAGTPVSAAGAGIVVEVKSDPREGGLVRITHRDGYESIYANLGTVRVARGDRVDAGAVIATSGGAARELPPHLHLEIRRGGADVNPTSIMKQGPAHGDFQ
jgi:murein DD-endopeptidase MepM/ murein hydrolase activator NlpD